MNAKLILWLVMLFSISACVLTPGMYMGTTSGESNVEVPVLESGELVTSRVIITPITADLVAQPAVPARRQPPAAGGAPQQKSYGPYRLGPGDILNITVWDHPELTIPAGEFRSPEAAGNVVAADGTLFYPYVGVLKVSGMSVEELRSILTSRLTRYIENPQLDVRVIAFRSQKAYVVGEVKQPGVRPITDVPLTVADAINLSGGLTPNADMLHVTLTRGDGRVVPIDLLALYEQGDLSQNLLLENGDVLNVPDNTPNKVFVLGEVGSPASRLLNKGRMSLAEALGDAGGVDPLTSNAGHVYVIRNHKAKPEIFHLDARSPDAMLLADRFSLAPHDVVFVDAAEVTRWNRVITQILPTAQTINQSTNSDWPTGIENLPSRMVK